MLSKTHRLFSQVRQKSINPRRMHWDLRRLRNATTCSYNVLPHNNTRAPTPSYVVYLKNCDTSSIVDDLIVSRHYDQFISCIVSSRTPVGIQLLERIWDKKLDSKLFLDHRNDGRIRVSLTVSCNEENEKSRMREMLRILDGFAQLPDSFKSLMPYILAENFVEEDIPNPPPLDEKYTPPYFKFEEATFSIGGYYYSHYLEDNAIIETKLPEIHQALLNNDYGKVNQLLLENPNLANKKDPIGLMAYQLAERLESSTYPLFAEIRANGFPKSEGDKRAQKRDRLLLQKWKVEKSEWEHTISAKEKEIYLNHLKQPLQKRSSLHQACIDGNMSIVHSSITMNPERIDEQDPRGFTPLLLAVANGHAQLTHWLLENGAGFASVSHTSIWGDRYVLRLIDNAATPEVLHEILRVSYDPIVLKLKLIASIQENNIRMTAYLSQYLFVDCEEKGLSALEYAIRLSGKNGTAIVKILLMNHTNFFPEGPYDLDLVEYVHTKAKNSSLKAALLCNIHPEVPDLIQKHNQNLHKQAQQMKERVRLRNEYILNRELHTELVSSSLHIRSVIKRVGELSEDECQKIRELFFENFEIIAGNTKENQRLYLESALSDTENRSAYITLFYDKNQLIAFFTFEIFHLKEATIFHAKLAANRNESDYVAQKLIKFSFRVVCALRELQPDKNIFVFAKAIPPGLGLAAILPYNHCKFYPKFQDKIIDSFVNSIVQETGETMEQAKMLAKLQVKCRGVNMNYMTSYYLDETLGNKKIALAICFEVDDEAYQQYQKHFNHYEMNMDSFKNIFQEFLLETKEISRLPSARP